MSEQIPTVNVHVVRDSTKAPERSRPPRRRSVRYRTISLSSAQPVAVVAGTEPLRHEIIVRASGTNSVYITDSEQAALAVANAGTGGGADTAFLLPAGSHETYESTEQVWCAAITYPATLSVMIVSREAE